MLERLKSMSVNYIMLLLVAIAAMLVLFCGPSLKDMQTGKDAFLAKGSAAVNFEAKGKPKRIISYAVSADEMLFALVGAERLLAVSPWSDFAAVSCIADKIKNVPHRARSQNIEAALAMQGDLIIIPDYANLEVVETLKASGQKVFVCRTPHNMEEIRRTILELGEIVGEQAKAKAIIVDMDKRLEAVRAKVAKVPEAKRLRVMRIQENGSYYAPNSSFMEICRLAGAKDATEELRYEHACTLSQEEIIALNPEMFVIEDWNYDGKHDPQQLKASILNNKAYATTEAGKNKRAVLMPANHLLTVSQYMVAAVEDMAEALYPEYVKR